MRTHALLVALLLAAAAFAGCATDNGNNANTGNTGNGNGQAVNATVTLGQLPVTALAGSQITLNWTVEVASPSNAQVPHTAVHFGNESHADLDNTSLRADTYPFSTSYQNGTGAHTDFMVPWVPGTYYLRAHAVVNGQNFWTNETSITVAPNPLPYVAMVKAPGTASRTGQLTFEWYVNATSGLAIPHTAIHYGPESHANLTNAQLTAATYPNGTNAPTYYNGTAPGTFTSTVPVPANATSVVYFRAHAVVAGQQLWSPEYRISVTG